MEPLFSSSTEAERPGPAWVEAVARALDARLSKIALAVLVIISVLPLDDAWEHRLRPAFLCVFGLELAARFVVWQRRREDESIAQVVFVVADVLAFVSFLPIEAVIGEDKAQVLALIRLTRLLMLMRFAKELALDIYTIMTRREQLQQFALVSAAVIVLSFVSAVVIAQLALPHPNDPAKDPGFIDDLWWSFRQMESPDNLVETVRLNPVVLVLSLGLTVTGVFVISFVIGIGSNVVNQVVTTERRRPLAYRGHTVVTGPVHTSEVLIREFVKIYAKNRQIPSPERLLTWLKHMSPLQTAKPFPRVALLGDRDDPPAYLWEPLMRWVVYRQGDPAETTGLDRVAAKTAKRAILLAKSELAHEADAVTIATLAAMRAVNKSAQIFVEVAQSDTVPIARQVGGAGTVALDMQHLLGMFLCQHLVTPGIEDLYRDLLTLQGSELYTHIFVDEAEKAALRAVSDAGHVRFSDLSRAALSRHGVYLIGVMLGDAEVSRAAHDNVPVDDVVAWLNPYVLPANDARVAAFGALPDQVPLAKLRGIIGICESYFPLAQVGREITLGTSVPLSKEAAISPGELEAIRAATSVPEASPKRCAIVGASDALPSMLLELARFVPGVDVLLFLSARDQAASQVKRRIEQLGVGFSVVDPLPGADGRAFSLERSGTLRVFTHDAPDLAGFAASVLEKEPPITSVAFLSEPEGDERDARTALRILRFVRLLEEGRVPHGGKLHVLAEFISVEKGAYIQKNVDVRKCGFHHEDDLKLTLVSMDTIKNYFMVHSAFVPGVARLYEELLEERGQEIVRVKLDAPPELKTTTMRAIQKALVPLGVIAFAVELSHDTTVLAPDPDQALTASEITGVYVIADQPVLARMKAR